MSKRLFLQLAAGFLGCLAGIAVAIGQENEYGIQMQCAQASTLVYDIPINNGVMTEQAVISGPVALISIPVTHNPDEYSGCLEIYGRRFDVEKMAYFDDLDRCKQQASSKPMVSISAKNDITLASNFNAREFGQCMQGPDGKLEVEIISE